MAKRLSQMISAKNIPVDTKLCAIRDCVIGSYNIPQDVGFKVTHLVGDFIKVKQLHPETWDSNGFYDHTLDAGCDTERLRLAYKNEVRNV